MKKLALYFFILFQKVILYSQIPSFTWAKQIGGSTPTTSVIVGIALDTNDNVVSIGSFNGAVDFDPSSSIYVMTPSGVGSEYFISKLDSAGNFLWAKQLHGAQIKEIVTANNGDIVLTGTFSDTVDFDLGTGVYTMIANAAGKEFLLRLDSNGNFLWAIDFGDQNTDITCLNIDKNGDIVLGGNFYGNVDFDSGVTTFNMTSASPTSFDIFICKLNSLGNFIWARRIGSTSEDKPYAITTDSACNIYTTGVFFETVDFDPGAGIYNLNSMGGAIFVSKLNGAGAFILAFPIIGYGGPVGIKVDTYSNIYLGGMLISVTTDFDPGVGIYYPEGDCFISKFNSTGTLSWVHGIGVSNLGLTYGSPLALDKNENPVLVGYFLNTVDFDPGASSFTFSPAVSTFNAFMWSLDTTGNFRWAGKIGNGTINNIAIATNRKGYLFINGEFNNIDDFDINAGVYNMNTSFATHVFVAKYKDCSPPLLSQPIIGNMNICSGTINTYSVASISGATTYTWTLPPGWLGSSTTNSISITAGSLSGNITVTANNLCGASIPQELAIAVNPTPNVTYTQEPDTTCVYSAAFNLVGGMPLMGAYSGAGVLAGVFDPNIAGIGSHTITYTYSDTNSCVDSTTQSIFVDICTNIESPNNIENILIYPNPTNSVLYINSNGIRSNVLIRVVNLLGETILITEIGSKKSSIDLTDFTDGIYILEINIDGQRIVKKITKG